MLVKLKINNGLYNTGILRFKYAKLGNIFHETNSIVSVKDYANMYINIQNYNSKMRKKGRLDRMYFAEVVKISDFRR